MDIDDIRKNLKNFFRGEETEKGQKLIDHWYHYFDDRPQELRNFSEEKKKQLRKELFANISESMHRHSGKQRSTIKACHSHNNHWLLKAAAGFIIVLFALMPVLYYQGVFTRHTSTIKTSETRKVSNPTGQTSKIALPDGSTVWLSAASTLEFPKIFHGNIRKVSLKGEAFFDVAHVPEKAFVVDCEQLQTKVLGTSFNVRVFKGEKEIQVTVASGRVAIQRKAGPPDNSETGLNPIAVLTPDQQLVFNKKTLVGKKRLVNAMLYTSWKDGKLIFENQSFKEIARRLEQWYGVQINFTKASLEQIRFKVTFDNSYLEHDLRMLQAIENFKYEMKGKQVWIKPS